ncbi:MauE/DoxX family redox-associated membrane protein [uncultured Abyssibacter sp.]|uniref:MauE/DoxX family redox-associated membrane protein n=1 Tax=uncultured Abyssibacter sp. TaxID=2320202 RepID=UPI0032B127D9
MREPAFNRIGRRFFGSLLLLAALTKLANFAGFIGVVASYGMMPDWAQLPVGLLAVSAEAGLGAWLWSGRRGPLACLLLVMLLVLYCSGLFFAYLDGRRLLNSGTFGTVVPLRVSLGLVLAQLGLLGVSFFLWSSVTAHRLREQLALDANPAVMMPPGPPTGAA